MIPGYNFWVTLSDVYRAELWPYCKWHSGQQTDPETGDPIPEPVPVSFPAIANISTITAEFLVNIHDVDAVERLFKPWNAAGRTYRNWSCYADKPAGTPQIRADLDMLIAADPNDFSISGAWSCADGTEVGSPPWYPVPSHIVNLMPDIIVDNTDPENPVYGPATQPTDVNLLFGQAGRSFASFTP